MDQSVHLEVDLTVGAAYVEVMRGRVVRTEPFDDATNVDLDEHDVVVGIELLSLDREWPMAGIAERFHVPLSVLKQVANITNPTSSGVLITGGSAGVRRLDNPSQLGPLLFA